MGFQDRQDETELKSFSLTPKISGSSTTTSQLEDGSIPKSKSRSGWIDGVYLCAKASCFVLLLNLVLISTAAGLASRYPNNGSFSARVFYQGSCTLSDRWVTALHLIINILSTAILAASNYCMQTLVAPTREEINKFHECCRWLDIGGASIRNLFAIGRYRLALWVVLLITATPFHLLYNSMIFQSLSANEYGTVNNASLVLPTPIMQHLAGMILSNIAKGNYDRLTRQQCVDFAGRLNQAGTKALVMLTNNLTVVDGGDASILLSSDVNSIHAGTETLPYGNQTHGPQDSATVCSNVSPTSSSWNDRRFAKEHWFDKCLAIRAEEHCQLLYSPPICIVICLTASVKVVAMFLAARVSRSRSPPLLTVGDAVASFITRPDPTTKGMCWISSADVHRGLWKSHTSILLDNSQHEVITYKRLSPRKHWGKASSKKRWLATFLLSLIAFLFAIYMVVSYSLPSSMHSGIHSWLNANQFSQFWNTESSQRDQAIDNSPQFNVLESIVLANIPQLFITITYYYYNSILTSMLAAAEYSSYGTTCKPLRVTWPVKNSQQRSTYWLSVPYQYGIPLLVTYMILHWLTSQSMFYVLVIPYNVLEHPDHKSKLSSINFSPLPIFLALLVGAVMLCLLVALAFRRFKSVMPLAGSCSAAISAACHPQIFEIILTYLDLDSVKALRLVHRTFSGRGIGPYFLSFLRQPNTDLSEHSLKSLPALVLNPRLKSNIHTLTIRATCFDSSEAKGILKTGSKAITESHGMFITSTREGCSPEDLSEAQADLDWVKAQRKIQDDESQEAVIDRLRSALRPFQELGAVRLGVAVVCGKGKTMRAQRAKKQRLRERASQTLYIALAAVVRSRVSVRELDIYRDTLAYDVPTEDIVSHMSSFSGDDLRVIGESLETLKLSMSIRDRKEPDETDAEEIDSDDTDTEETGDKGKNLESEKASVSRTVSEDEMPGISSLLEVSPNLRRLDLHLRGGFQDQSSEMSDNTISPLLQEFSLAGFTLTEKSLLSFLEKHPTIQRLDLEEIHMMDGPWTPIFDHLSTQMPDLADLRLSTIWGRVDQRSQSAANTEENDIEPPRLLNLCPAWAPQTPTDRGAGYPCRGGWLTHTREFSAEELRKGLRFRPQPSGRSLGSPNVMQWMRRRRALYKH
ncbi:hypothetical protein SI65_07701 [Aspergillus cristatus]|uniref:DUF6536 domain-containing protein n=1 Tax=Aspergillus cristatus TaxID=573508 RepID=A0A1E3B8J7_ASPCR|nr:hypothetical protein SI65_07701 [Aspergillus cristatus]